MLWIAVRRPPLAIIFFFFFFAFTWRLVSVLYVDLFGPLFSEQLERDIGQGDAAVPLALSQIIVIVALVVSLRAKRLNGLTLRNGQGLASHLPPGRFTISDVAFAVICPFVIALYAELLVRGPIPLFVGMERFDYARQFGGPLHQLLLKWGFMLAFQIGLFFAIPILHNRRLDRRFAFLLASLLLYLILVGHRFSSIYGYCSFFIMPLGAVLLVPRISSKRDLSGKILRGFALGAAALILLIVGAVSYSYLVVRGFEGGQLSEKVSQRLFVQQGEMWWMTYERVFCFDNWNSTLTSIKLFISPFNPNRNSTMQYLMELALPLSRAHEILRQGSAYTGGWPEVLFELGGPVGGFLLVAVAAIIFSEFMYLMIRCIVEERLATTLCLTALFFTLSVHLVSGMVNSFIQLTFLVKIGITLIVYLTEDRWRAEVLSLPMQTKSNYTVRSVG
jgi:Family of unknown function (DUF6418)